VSKTGYTFRAFFLQQEIERHLPAYTEKDFQNALADLDGQGIMCTAPNGLRGDIARLLYLRLKAGDCSPNTFREALDAAWNHDHGWVIDAVKNRRALHSMFKHAQFPVPEEMPEAIEIWRGVSGGTLWLAKRGISWTTNRDVACWFAMRFANTENAPLVLKAIVPKTAVFHLANDRDEYEVVCFDAPNAEIDGHPQDWREAQHRRRIQQQAKEQAWMDAAIARRKSAQANASASTWGEAEAAD